MSDKTSGTYEFGPFIVDPANKRLLRGGEPVTLDPKVFDLLLLLIERKGQLFTKNDLMEALWPDTNVGDASLSNHIYKLRKALGEWKEYVVTEPKRGYYFVADAPETLVVERHTLKRVRQEVETEVTGGGENVFDTAPASRTLQAAPAATPPARGRLRLYALGLACLLLAAAGAALYRPASTREKAAGAAAAGARPIKSIAVLPFETMGSEPDKDYLGLGLADALITRLGNVRQLVVRPTSAVRRYAGGKKDSIMAGREQGVDAVLGGTVQREGDRLRLTAQLVRVSDGATLWAEKYDTQFKDIFTTQDEISGRVWCDVVTRVCDGGLARPAVGRQIKIEAYEAYLKGRYFWGKRDGDGIRKAIDYFGRAVAIEPDYAEAHAALGGAYALADVARMSPAEAFDRARAETRRALELDPDLADAHANLGLISMNYDREWGTAERELKRAVELSPNDPIVHDWYGEYLNAAGRHDEAVAELERARELDPLSVIVNSDKCKMLYFARRYGEAAEQCKRALELDPTFGQAEGFLFSSYWLAGSRGDARAVLNERLASTKDPQERLMLQAVMNLSAGQTAEALRMTRQLERPARTGEFAAGTMAELYAYLGDKDQAFAWLEKAYEARSPYLNTINSSPVFDGLRSDPRLADLVKRVGLPQ